MQTTESVIPTHLQGTDALTLLQEIANWGNTTTIIQHGGSVFEFKGDFPEGVLGEGYYNLKGSTGFEGHLNLEKIARIELQSRNHRGRESHAFVFINKEENIVFKIFLGRDSDGNFLSKQLGRFQQILSTLSL